MALGTSGPARLKQGAAGRMDVKDVLDRSAQTANRFKERTAKARDQTDRMKGIREEMAEAIVAKDIDKMKILNATFAEARADYQKNSRDLSAVMGGLLTGYQDIGVALKAAEQFTADEQKLIDNASALVEESKRKLGHAENDWYILPGGKKRAVKAANEAIATAENGVVTATQMAEALRRERLNNMSIQQSMQLQQGITQELTELAQDRIAGIQENLEEIQVNTDILADQLKTEAKKLEDLDKALEQANAELHTLQEELAGYAQNSSEWQACRDRIRLKERERNHVESDRNATFLRNEQAQVFIESSKIQEDGQRELLAQHKNWIAILQLGAQQRDVQYGVYLDLLKDNADQEAMSRVDEISSETDERVAENTAQIVQSMRDNTMKWMDRAPKRLDNMRKIVGANVEGQAAFEAEVNRRIDEFKKSLHIGYDDRETYRGEHQPAA